MSSDKERPDPRMNQNGRVEDSTTCGSSPFVQQHELDPRFDSGDAFEWGDICGRLREGQIIRPKYGKGCIARFVHYNYQMFESI